MNNLFPFARALLRMQFPNKDGFVSKHTRDDPGKPLFLTPYIEKGDVQTGS